MWITVLGTNVYHICMENSLRVYTTLTTYAKSYMAGQVKKESHNSNKPYLMIKINRNRSDLFTYRSKAWFCTIYQVSLLRDSWKHREQCNLVVVLPGSSWLLCATDFMGAKIQDRELRVPQGALGLFGLILNDLLRYISIYFTLFWKTDFGNWSDQSVYL